MILLFSPTLGVPQGTVLSPFLFTLFVNSGTSVLYHDKLHTFADDIKIFLRINSANNCMLFQDDLSHLIFGATP